MLRCLLLWYLVAILILVTYRIFQTYLPKKLRVFDKRYNKKHTEWKYWSRTLAPGINMFYATLLILLGLAFVIAFAFGFEGYLLQRIEESDLED